MKALALGIAASLILMVVIAIVLQQLNPDVATRQADPDAARVGEAGELRRGAEQ
jgi:hypothetical protein